MQISAIRNLYFFEDGDTITPGMGVKIDAGYGLQQYWNPTTKKVVATDFTEHNATLYPQPYSTKKADIVVPETAGQQWYYNNISDEGAILEDGAVKEKFKNTFKVDTITLNGKTFPALVIIGNLATEADHTDKHIYYSSTYDGRQIICQQLIPIQSSVGDAFKILLSVEGADGSCDNVLSNDNDWVKYTANLQLAGQNIASDVTYKFQRLEGTEWKDQATISSVQEVNGNSFKLYNAGVEGVELFKVVAIYNGKEYSDTFEVTDIHDPFYVDDGCSCPGDAVHDGETVTFNPRVYDRSSGEDVTERDGWTFTFILLKRSDKSVITEIDQTALTGENIEKYGGITVRTVANR